MRLAAAEKINADYVGKGNGKNRSVPLDPQSLSNFDLWCPVRNVF
jgi:hypothetical protein